MPVMTLRFSSADMRFVLVDMMVVMMIFMKEAGYVAVVATMAVIMGLIERW